MGLGSFLTGLVTDPIGSWDRFKNGSINDVNKKIADQNLGFQQENLDYQKALQQQIFEREDTAYERTVNDMRNAGLSPLAMNGTDGAGQAVQTDALNNSFQHNDIGNLSAIATIAQTLSGIAYNSAEVDKLRAEAKKTEAEADDITFKSDLEKRYLPDERDMANKIKNFDYFSAIADYDWKSANNIVNSMSPEIMSFALMNNALGKSNSGYVSMDNILNYLFDGSGYVKHDSQHRDNLKETSEGIGALLLASGLGDLFKGLIPNVNLSGISKKLKFIKD